MKNRDELELTAEETKRVGAVRPVSREAHDAYLKGKYHTYRWSQGDLDKGVEQLQMAVGLDPGYAEAYAGLAMAYRFKILFGTRPPRELIPGACRAADKALDLDPALAEAHFAVGCCRSLQRRWSEAEQEFRRAVELNPTLPEVHLPYAWTLVGQGRLDDALREIQRAVELDPLSPMLHTVLGAILYFQRRYDEAIAQLQATVALDPTSLAPHGYLTAVYLVLGRYEEAIAACDKTVGPGIPMVRAASYAALGKHTEANRVMEKLADSISGISLPYRTERRFTLRRGMF